MRPLRLARAENDVVTDVEGRRYVDLFTAHGAAWLGHTNAHVARRVARQLETIWITGGLETEILARAHAAVDRLFPETHALVTLYSTGMEAAEFAIRLSRQATGRLELAGFARSMHGKSLATAQLGWDNGDGVELPFSHRLPFVGDHSEDRVLDCLSELLAGGRLSALFVEPLQGSGGGHAGSAPFYAEVARRCREQGTLLVFDEILTGFYRTGSRFWFSDLDFVPDVVLIGKALGNGFPVSGVVADRRLAIDRRMLPGSTYSGNPLAAAAVVATLERMEALDLPAAVAAIDDTIRTELAPLQQSGIAVRGRGALWILELPPAMDVAERVLAVYRRGVSIGFSGRQLRVLPPATIEPANLKRACTVVREELLRGRE